MSLRGRFEFQTVRGARITSKKYLLFFVAPNAGVTRGTTTGGNARLRRTRRGKINHETGHLTGPTSRRLLFLRVFVHSRSYVYAYRRAYTLPPPSPVVRRLISVDAVVAIGL